MARRSPFIAAIVQVALSNSSEPLTALAADDDEETILRLLGLDLTPNERMQLRWLIWKAILQEAIDGTRKEARCKIAIEKRVYGDRCLASAMEKAWQGKSGVGAFAKIIVRKMTADEKAKVVSDLMRHVPSEY